MLPVVNIFVRAYMCNMHACMGNTCMAVNMEIKGSC